MSREGQPRRRAILGTSLVACAIVAALVVLQLGGSRSPRPHAGAPWPPAAPATLRALGDLAVGMPLGTYRIENVSEPTDGAVLVRASSPAGEVTYEVRLLAERPLPAARTALYAVYYRGTDGGAEVLGGAAALATLLEKSPAGKPPLPGLTQYPTVFTAL